VPPDKGHLCVMYLHRDALHCLKIAKGIILSGVYMYISLPVVLVLEMIGWNGHVRNEEVLLRNQGAEECPTLNK